MIDFKFCYPDANTFNKVLKIKTLENWKVEYYPLEDDIGYWIAENPFENEGFELFKNLVASFPIQKDNNLEGNLDPNPFDTIHLPEWAYVDLCMLIRDFYFKNITTEICDPQIHEWGNVYFKERAKPISCWRIPHVDYAHGLVGNLWFTDHDLQDSSTKIYKYDGKMEKEIYDFQINQDHPMFKKWKSMAENPKRTEHWFNMEDKDLEEWGFKLLGSIPTKEGTMTMYKANVHHSAYVSNNVDFRWSHAFAFSHETPKELVFGDILK